MLLEIAVFKTANSPVAYSPPPLVPPLFSETVESEITATPTVDTPPPKHELELLLIALSTIIINPFALMPPPPKRVTNGLCAAAYTGIAADRAPQYVAVPELKSPPSLSCVVGHD